MHKKQFCVGKKIDVAQKVIWCPQKQYDAARKIVSCQQKQECFNKLRKNNGKSKIGLLPLAI